jgi:hypothetical protein
MLNIISTSLIPVLNIFFEYPIEPVNLILVFGILSLLVVKVLIKFVNLLVEVLFRLTFKC